MRFLPAILIPLYLLTTPALAERVDTTTRLGPARIVDAPGGARALALGNRMVKLPGGPALAFIEARRGDLLLITISQGGNACPARYVWVHATPGDLRLSPVFGTCADEVTVTHDAETVRVTMGAFQPGQGDVTFVYDGRRITRRQAGLLPSGVVAPDDWKGRYPFELLAAAELQAPLRALLGAEGLRAAQRIISLSSPMEQEGHWVAGTGCEKQSCLSNHGVVAVNTEDGRILVGLVQQGSRPQLWGEADGPLPRAVHVFLGN